MRLGYGITTHKYFMVCSGPDCDKIYFPCSRETRGIARNFERGIEIYLHSDQDTLEDSMLVNAL